MSRRQIPILEIAVIPARILTAVIVGQALVGVLMAVAAQEDLIVGEAQVHLTIQVQVAILVLDLHLDKAGI